MPSRAPGDTPADPDASVVTLAAQSLATVSDRGEPVRDAHARHFAALLGEGGSRLGTELDNVRVAVDRAVEALPDLLDRPLVQSLTGHYLSHGHLLEGCRVLREVAGVAPTAAARAWAWRGAAIANRARDHAS